MTKEELRMKASDALVEAGSGTVASDMGSGKSWIALESLFKVSGNFPTGHLIKVLITSPRTNLKDSWKVELSKYGLEHKSEDIWMAYDKDTGEIIEYEFTLENVQTAFRWHNSGWIKFDVIIADEIHTMVTEEYSKVFRIPHKHLFGFTGTTDERKGEKVALYQRYAPIVYRYTEAAEDGMINKRKYILFKKSLRESDKVTLQRKKKFHIMGEFAANKYLEHMVSIRDVYVKKVSGSSEPAWTSANKLIASGVTKKKIAGFAYKKAVRERMDFLYNIPSNVRLVNLLIRTLKEVDPTGKVLVFSKRNEQIAKICKDFVYHKQTAKENKEALRKFNDDEIDVLGSCESLTLGLNLTRPKYAIVEAFNSSSTEILQKLGRTNRLNADEYAYTTFIVPKGTQYEKWFESIMYETGLEYSDFIIVENSVEFKEALS